MCGARGWHTFQPVAPAPEARHVLAAFLQLLGTDPCPRVLAAAARCAALNHNKVQNLNFKAGRMHLPAAPFQYFGLRLIFLLMLLCFLKCTDHLRLCCNLPAASMSPAPSKHMGQYMFKRYTSTQ
jgi:hypothetical protein